MKDINEILMDECLWDQVTDEELNILTMFDPSLSDWVAERILLGDEDVEEEDVDERCDI